LVRPGATVGATVGETVGLPRCAAPGVVVGLDPFVGVAVATDVVGRPVGAMVEAWLGTTLGPGLVGPDGVVAEAGGTGASVTALVGVLVGLGFDSGRTASGSGINGVSGEGPPSRLLTRRRT